MISWSRKSGEEEEEEKQLNRQLGLCVRLKFHDNFGKVGRCVSIRIRCLISHVSYMEEKIFKYKMDTFS